MQAPFSVAICRTTNGVLLGIIVLAGVHAGTRAQTKALFRACTTNIDPSTPTW